MKKTYVILFVVIAASLMLLTGCQTTGQLRQGNYISQDIMINDALAADAHKVMLNTFPPARVKLALSGSNENVKMDAFGQALVERLRKSGYAISDTLDQTKKSMDDVDVLPFNLILFTYIIDQIGDDSNIRVTLLIGDDILTRGYSKINGEIKPLGAWTYMLARDRGI